MSKQPAVLAYSGGLDTSAIVAWLQERDYEVHAVLVDVGQDEDLPAICQRALDRGAASAVIHDAKAAMMETVIPRAIGLAATYEGNYRLGTALARPFIAQAQVQRARQLGGGTLVHGATGKGNDQVRFEFAYRSLAPDLPVLAPWKTWDLEGREDLVAYLRDRGVEGDFEAVKLYSLDENLWHLSVEGGSLEDPCERLDVENVLAAVNDRFATEPVESLSQQEVEIDFEHGVPVALNGQSLQLVDIIDHLNRGYRFSPWAWDLVLENRFTGIKSRGVYINPAAKLLHLAADALARCLHNKPTYDLYAEWGRAYGELLYRGAYLSDQRLAIEAASDQVLQKLTGSVTVALLPTLYAAKIVAPDSVFRRDLATFEASDFSHAHADGFIQLSWLSCVGRPFAEPNDDDDVETAGAPAPGVRAAQQLPGGGLVPSPV
ncbi:MAG: argininosuccinate synthase [bacterium]|nr:argininosuccinate synthase [bacterium]